MNFEKCQSESNTTKSAKMSKLKILFIVWVLSLCALSYLLYTPLPEGLEDHVGAMIAMAGLKLLVLFPVETRRFLGQGTFYNNLKALQDKAKTAEDAPPLTSWFGGLNVTRATIEGMHVIVYRHWDAEDTPLRPGTIFFHGGGWTFGNADTHDWTVYDLALCTGTVAISVDYRLAPQHPFPAAFYDAVSVTRHILRHGAKFGIDVTRVGVAGDSAGANLAAASALHLVKTPSDHPPLIFQALMYPILQALNCRLPSHTDNNDALPSLSAQFVGALTSIYLGLGDKNGEFHGGLFASNRHVSLDLLTNSKYANYVNESNLPEKYRSSNRAIPIPTEPHDDRVFQRIKDIIVDPRFSPLMADDLSGLPTTHIVVQKYDVLRDDGLLYAKRLRDFGVETSVHDGNGFHSDYIKILPNFLLPKTGIEASQNLCNAVTKAVKSKS